MNELATLHHNEIKQRLLQPLETTYDVPRNNTQPLKKAAVLVPFVQHNGEWHLLYIQRSVHEKDRHSGQVAFAGGKYEEGDDSLTCTALREAHEEIGINPEHVMVLGELNKHHSISHFQITPVVATLPWPYQLTLQHTEVAATFTIPLRWLADPANHTTKPRNFNGKEVPVVYFKKYNNYLLWGATARMTLSLLDRLQTPALS